MKPDHIPSQELTDETLCRLAASGDRVAEERLVMRYNRLVRMCARPYFLAGGDSEDLIQEGMPRSESMTPPKRLYFALMRRSVSRTACSL